MKKKSSIKEEREIFLCVLQLKYIECSLYEEKVKQDLTFSFCLGIRQTVFLQHSLMTHHIK